MGLIGLRVLAVFVLCSLPASAGYVECVANRLRNEAIGRAEKSNRAVRSEDRAIVDALVAQRVIRPGSAEFRGTWALPVRLSEARSRGMPVTLANGVVVQIARRTSASLVPIYLGIGDNSYTAAAEDLHQGPLSAYASGHQSPFRGSQPVMLDPDIRIARGVGGREQVFERDTTIEALGEAWAEPIPADGSHRTIWGSVVRNGDGSIWMMTFDHALIYCRSQGLDLPTRADFMRFRRLLGSTAVESDWRPGYAPQGILPDLEEAHGFWSSSLRAQWAGGAQYFDGRSGTISSIYCGFLSPVRCVSRR